MDFERLTKEYYSKWLGVSYEVLNEKGVIFVESEEREVKQKGYGDVFDIYTYVEKSIIVVSLSPKLKNYIYELKDKIKLGMTGQQVTDIMKSIFSCKVDRSIKFVYEKLKEHCEDKKAVSLCREDYAKYLEFFMEMYGWTKPEEWLDDYFSSMCKEGHMSGIYANQTLVSVSDTPEVPYMMDIICDIGINTLPTYQRRGYGKLVVEETIAHIIEGLKCPIWSCNGDNIASINLAKAVGFRELAEVVAISIL